MKNPAGLAVLRISAGFAAVARGHGLMPRDDLGSAQQSSAPTKILRLGVRYGFIVVVQTRRWSAQELRGGRAGSAVNRKRMHIIYSGHVQGVGFRYTVRSVAMGFEVTGTVRNLPDGRVELLAEGTREELEGFRAEIPNAGLGHFIRKEEVAWAEPRNDFDGFGIG